MTDLQIPDDIAEIIYRELAAEADALGQTFAQRLAATTAYDSDEKGDIRRYVFDTYNIAS